MSATANKTRTSKLLGALDSGASRTFLAVALACFWLVDGLFQLQPRMFTPDFANGVLSNSAQNQPVIVSAPISHIIHLVLSDPVAFGIAFALIQLLLGVLILMPRTRVFGLALSVVWAILVWVLGEGMGGLLTGQAGLLTGFPGAALIYAILAIAALPVPRERHKRPMPAAWLNVSWAVIWIGGAVYQLLPGQNSTFNMAGTITQAANGAPAWLGAINSEAAVLTRDCGIWLVLVLALVEVAIGIGIFMPDYIRHRVLYLSIVISILFWVVGQDLGGWYTGLATDPNSGPLFVLFALALLGSDRFVTWSKEI